MQKDNDTFSIMQHFLFEGSDMSNCNVGCFLEHCQVMVWLNGNVLVSINIFALRRAQLVLGRMTVHAYTILVFNPATQANSA